jgi:hypothetical protein
MKSLVSNRLFGKVAIVQESQIEGICFCGQAEKIRFKYNSDDRVIPAGICSSSVRADMQAADINFT